MYSVLHLHMWTLRVPMTKHVQLYYRKEIYGFGIYSIVCISLLVKQMMCIPSKKSQRISSIDQYSRQGIANGLCKIFE